MIVFTKRGEARSPQGLTRLFRCVMLLKLCHQGIQLARHKRRVIEANE